MNIFRYVMVEAVITLILYYAFCFFLRIIDYILGFMLISAGLPNSFHRMSVIILIGKIVRVKKKSIYLQFFNYKVLS